MKLTYSGVIDLLGDNDRVFALLGNPEFLIKSIPDVESSKRLDDRSFEAVIKLKLSIVSSSIRTLIQIREATKDSVVIHASGSGGGSSIALLISFQRNPKEIRWSADAEVSGLISGLGSSILNTFAKRKIEETIRSIQKAAAIV
ncbi:MAG: SRPBCC domain-containing protein [Nitrososphaerota archaeon]